MTTSLAETILSAATEVHQQLGGPGLLEGVYESALSHELKLRGIKSERQIAVPVLYKGQSIREPLFLDLLVEKQIVVEIKSSEKHYPFYLAQLQTYLRFTNLPHGILINFGKEELKDGIYRVTHQPQIK